MKKLYTVITKEWFDRINSNSYCAVRIYNNSTGNVIAYLPFGHGYGNYGEQRAREWLEKHRPTLKMVYLSERAIAEKIEGCLKRDVIAWGKES
jgi:hypothetical protein